MSIADFGVLAAAVAACAGGIGYLIRARRDWAATRAEEHATENSDVRALLEIKDEMIVSLREQNVELVRHEDEMRSKIVRLEERVEELDDSYKSLVKAVVESAVCAKAPGCVDYVAPGERRK